MAELESYKPPLKSPLTVSLWIAEECNLSCKYCYADPTSGKLMETERLHSLINELADLEIFDMTIAGGEPFLHPDIFGIIDQTLKRRIQLGVLTNGVSLDKKARSHLADIVTGKHFILQVSLDSPDPSVNDRTRGRGATVISNLRELSKMDIQIQISCVLNRYNIETAHLIIDEFYPAVKRFHFLNIQRTKRSLKNPELLISEEQAYEFWMRLKEYSKEFPFDLFLPSLRIMLRSYGEEDSSESHSFHKKATFTCKSCSVGITKVEIDSDFNVLGCDIAKDFSTMGNVRNASFTSVWNSYQAYQVRNSPFPPCYKIVGPDGEALQDYLKPMYQL